MLAMMLAVIAGVLLWLWLSEREQRSDWELRVAVLVKELAEARLKLRKLGEYDRLIEATQAECDAFERGLEDAVARHMLARPNCGCSVCCYVKTAEGSDED